MKPKTFFGLALLAGSFMTPAAGFAQDAGASANNQGSASTTNTTTSGDLGITTRGNVGIGTDTNANIDPNAPALDSTVDDLDSTAARDIESDVDTDSTAIADFGAYDQNGDGTVTQSEFTASAVLSDAGQTFEDLDTDGDGRLSQAEFDTYANSTNDASGGVRASR